jgi:hypothetical protein
MRWRVLLAVSTLVLQIGCNARLRRRTTIVADSEIEPAAVRVPTGLGQTSNLEGSQSMELHAYTSLVHPLVHPRLKTIEVQGGTRKWPKPWKI